MTFPELIGALDFIVLCFALKGYVQWDSKLSFEVCTGDL